MPSTIIDSAIFGNIFSSRRDARGVVGREPNPEVSRHRSGAGARAGPSRDHSAGGGRRDRAQLRDRQDRHGQAASSRPSASAIRFSASCRSSTRCAATSSASTATGVRRRRTSPTPPRCCRSAKRSSSSTTILARSRRRSPISPGAIATRRWSRRSNLQQAVPITFGYKMAELLSAVERHRERLAQLRPRVLVGEFGGAAARWRRSRRARWKRRPG